MRQPVYKDKAITLLTPEETNIKELEQMAEKLIDYLQYQGKKNGWEGKIILCCSEHKSNLAIKMYKSTGGRPKKFFYEPPRIKNIKTKPHIHMMLLDAYPNDEITKGMNSYWTKRNGEKTTHFQNITAEKGGRIGYFEYMLIQESNLRGGDLQGTKEYRCVLRDLKSISKIEKEKVVI